MSRGFLGYDASFMLDFVVVALVLLVPLLMLSIAMIKRGKYQAHKSLQLLIAGLLLVTVLAFEVDMRMHGGWLKIINKNPEQPRLASEALTTIGWVLATHLVFAVSTPILWAVTLSLAWKRFPRPPAPGAHSRLHKTLGWLSALDLVLTSVTGLMFYYVAFMKTW